jgi:hypothetical protein
VQGAWDVSFQESNGAGLFGKVVVTITVTNSSADVLIKARI